jgi:hypothetical protein
VTADAIGIIREIGSQLAALIAALGVVWVKVEQTHTVREARDVHAQLDRKLDAVAEATGARSSSTSSQPAPPLTRTDTPETAGKEGAS